MPGVTRLLGTTSSSTVQLLLQNANANQSPLQSLGTPLACVLGAGLAWRVAPRGVRKFVAATVGVSTVIAAAANSRLNALADDMGTAYRTAKRRELVVHSGVPDR